MLTFKVPAGIGDISWVYSKCSKLAREFQFIISDDQPQRSLEYTKLLPRLKDSSYGHFTYMDVFVRQRLGLPAGIDLSTLPDGEYYLSVNSWLEEGGRLERFAPFQQTEYHYEMDIPEQYKHQAIEMLAVFHQKPVAVYPSGYKNYQGAWQFWSVGEWANFLEGIYQESGRGCVILGASFDNGLNKDLIDELNKRNIPCVDAVGKCHIGATIELIRRSHALFAFSSGIGVLGDVVDVPTVHFLPLKLADLMNSYADPRNIMTKRHQNFPFSMKPAEALEKYFQSKEVAQ